MVPPEAEAVDDDDVVDDHVLRGDAAGGHVWFKTRGMSSSSLNNIETSLHTETSSFNTDRKINTETLLNTVAPLNTETSVNTERKIIQKHQ